MRESGLKSQEIPTEDKCRNKKPLPLELELITQTILFSFFTTFCRALQESHQDKQRLVDANKF